MNTFDDTDVPDATCISDLIELARCRTRIKNIDEEVLGRLLPELEHLERMVGMTTLKDTVFHQIIYYLQGMHHRGNDEYLHTVITGPPGCGKTSVARILGQIYKTLGVLSEDASFTVAKREDLIAPYLGQTAIKTRLLLESSLKGVLFIDEAYSLGPGGKEKDSFSKEAIDTLTAFLSDHKKDFCCIIAGYEREIGECFFEVNRGLERRFPWVHRIQPYSCNELAQIMVKMIKDMEWDITMKIDDLTDFIKKHPTLFPNFAGDVETFLSKCKMAHALRVFSLDERHRCILTKEDFAKAVKIAGANSLLKQDELMDQSLLSLYT